VTALPYDGSSGWSGSDTSKARADQADIDGTTQRTQILTIASLIDAGRDGLTWKELSQLQGWHHGQASGVLSVLHKVGVIVRLKETRDRCKVYVDKDEVHGRDVEPHGRSKVAKIADILCGCFCCSKIEERLS
jgi:hypothetical protein